MLDKITPDSVANEIRLTRTHPTGRDRVFVLVEGPSDQRLYRKFFCNDAVEIRIAPGGKIGISGIFEKLDPNIDKLIGIRDADFARLLPEEIPTNIFLTDMHDLEMMMIHSDSAFDAVVCEHHEVLSAPDLALLRQTLLHALRPIGFLRFINEKDRKELNFSGMSLQKHVQCDSTSVSLLIIDYITELCTRSPQSQNSENLLTELRYSEQYVLTELCNGHDFFEILAVYFSKTKAPPSKKYTDLESAMRVAYSYEDFQRTGLFSQLMAWSTTTKCSLLKLGQAPSALGLKTPLKLLKGQ